jgi:AraC family transcriptional regulator, alkane utilization regulator
MDALSDVLRAVRLTGAVYLNAEFSAPWCVTARTDQRFRDAFLPGTKRIIAYHLVVEGAFRAWLPDNPAAAVDVSAGDIIVIPHAETHTLGSANDLPPRSFVEIAGDKMENVTNEVMCVSYGGGGANTRIVCGFLACDDVLTNPLVASLPRIFKVEVGKGSGSAWLTSSLRYAAEEAATSRAGGSMMLAKLSELLFVEAIRLYVEALPEGQKNWLAGLRDRFVGRALGLMHARPAHDWTVDELAREVGLSRSALAQRFSDFLDQPPMQYLAHWRLLIASERLLNTTASVTDVAASVGYESEAAFNRAFKREFGEPPAGWRRARRADPKSSATPRQLPAAE